MRMVWLFDGSVGFGGLMDGLLDGRVYWLLLEMGVWSER